MIKELERCKDKGYICQSFHEAYGLLAEEMHEFFMEVCKRTSKRDPDNALHELVQIAAMCERAAVDLGLMRDFALRNGEEKNAKFVAT